MSTRSGILLAIVAATLWGVSGTAAAGVFDEVGTSFVTELRALSAAMLFVPFALARREFPKRETLPALLAFGATLTVVTYSFYVAIDHLGVGPGATIQFVAPLYILVWDATRGRRLPGLAWVAATAALLGVGLLTRAWDATAIDTIGIAAGVIASISFAIYLVLGEHLAVHYSPPALVGYGFGITALFWLFAEPIWKFPTNISATAWWQLATVAVLGSALPFMIELAALRRARASIIGIVATLEPVVGATAAWLFLSQRLAAVQTVGIVLVLGAIAAIQQIGSREGHIGPRAAAR
ncbi:MAG: EamA family transporter [Acidimicrobiia bacterium]|nr:EamA family transporter [Acidimicrobiia bacterium]